MSQLALSRTEQAVLAECESIVERGMESFIEVGNALLRIRNERLYRAEFGTFQEYCEAKWQMSDRHAHRLIDAAEIAGTLKTDQLVSESQVRPLAPLEPAQQREAWQAAVEAAPNGKPTAKQVTAAVEKVTLSKWEPGQVEPPAESSESDVESDSLFQLKRIWKRTNKKDRAAFLKWAQPTK